MNVRIEYEETPIRNLAVQCPKCSNWFAANEITDDDIITYTYELNSVDFICPVCGTIFTGVDGLNIEEFDNYKDVYEDCLHKKVVWE